MDRTRSRSVSRFWQATLLSWILLSLSLFASSAVAQDGWKAVDPSGIHYAVPRNILHPDRWQNELLQTYDCTIPCIVDLDDRLNVLYLRYKWAQVNPASGVYNFDDLGQILTLLHNADKKATLIVMAGKYTPDWIFEAGAVPLPMKIETSGRYSQPNMPLPWDPVFVAAYGQMIDALSQYLRRSPELYRTVVMVKNGALIVHSGEVRLMPPKAYGVPDDKAAVEAFREANCRDWARSGYSEDKILEANRITNAQVATAFPDQYIGMAYVGGSSRFPTVDPDGTCSYPARNKTLNRIIRQTVETYGERAIINNTVFSTEIGIPPALQWTLDNGGRVGAQMNRRLVGCHQRKAGDCPDAIFAASVESAVSAGFTYLEVHDGNIHRNQDILRAANKALGR